MLEENLSHPGNPQNPRSTTRHSLFIFWGLCVRDFVASRASFRSLEGYMACLINLQFFGDRRQNSSTEANEGNEELGGSLLPSLPSVNTLALSRFGSDVLQQNHLPAISRQRAVFNTLGIVRCITRSLAVIVVAVRDPWRTTRRKQGIHRRSSHRVACLLLFFALHPIA